MMSLLQARFPGRCTGMALAICLLTLGQIGGSSRTSLCPLTSSWISQPLESEALANRGLGYLHAYAAHLRSVVNRWCSASKPTTGKALGTSDAGPSVMSEQPKADAPVPSGYPQQIHSPEDAFGFPEEGWNVQRL